MPNFSPSGKIKIGRVPFDNSYAHTMTFGNAEAQTDYFSSVCNQSLDRASYTYVRLNNSIRVPFNAESLYTYNYCMYQNSNYGTKWFYAFIIGINYINENATELVLELDVMQTWYFDYVLKEGFVEREHVDDDSLDANLNPEPEMPMNSIAKTVTTPIELDAKMAVVQTNAYPNYKGMAPMPLPLQVSGSKAVSGGLYNNIYNGAKLYKFSIPSEIYGTEKTQHGDEIYEHRLEQFLKDINECGAADSISNIFMYPEALFTGNAGIDQGLPTDTQPKHIEYSAERPMVLDGDYVPRNNKLYTFPYCYCMITNNNGVYAQLKWELWENGYRYNIDSAVEADATAFVIPQNYAGIENNVDAGINFPVTGKCSWIYSAYQTWAAQNSLKNTITTVGSAIAMIVPAARGISGAVKALGVGKAAKTASSIGKHAKTTSNNGIRAALNEGKSSIGKADEISLAAGAAGAAGLAADYQRMMFTPDTQKGQANGNSLLAIGEQRIKVMSIVPKREFCEIADGFFDMYGYQVDKVKVPNRTGRPNWNYVKMQNACHRGNVPAEDMAQINAIYNSGITFWHTSDIGNYSLPNKV